MPARELLSGADYCELAARWGVEADVMRRLVFSAEDIPVDSWLDLILSIGLGFLYMPGSPSALLWPQEWAIVILWCVLGGVLFAMSRTSASR